MIEFTDNGIKYTKKYVLALLLIAILALCSFFISQHFSQKTRMNAPSVKISTEQEILVKEILFLIMTLNNIEEESNYDTLKGTIFEKMKDLKHNYKKMIGGDEDLQLFSAASNENIHQVYFGERYDLDNKLNEFSNNANKIMNATFDQKDKFSHEYEELRCQNDGLSISLKALRDAYVKESESKLAALHKVEIRLFYVMILLLFFIGLLMFFPMVRQITRDQKKLESAKSKIETILNTVGEGILVINDQYQIINSNPEVQKIWGFTEKQLQDQPLSLLLAASNVHKLCDKENIKKLLNQFTNFEGQRKGGSTFPLEIKITTTTINEEKNYIIAARDITIRKRAEQVIQHAKETLEKNVAERTFDLKKTNENLTKRKGELREINRKLTREIKEKQKMERYLEAYSAELKQSNNELEQFAYVASHDLKQPLRMVGSYVQLLKNRYEHLLDKEGKEFMQYAFEGSQNATKLINELLKYACIGQKSSGFNDIDLNELLYHVKDNLKLQIQNSQANILVDKLPLIKGNYINLVQLFQNLISNAMKFRRKDIDSKIKVSFEEEDKTYIFAVSDNGVGIESIYQNKIFRIFHRLEKQKYEGTGIGLAICKKVVELHKGKIWLESTPNQGTTFYFSIPKTIMPVLNSTVSSKVTKQKKQVPFPRIPNKEDF